MKIKAWLYKMATVCSSLTLLVALLADGSKSYAIYHQPKVPAALSKFRK